MDIDPSRDTHPDEASQGSIAKFNIVTLGDFTRQRNIISYLAEFGNTVILRKMLETGEYKEFEIQHLVTWELSPLYYASSEDVVELLIEFAQDVVPPCGLYRNEAVTNTRITMGDESSNTLLSPQIIERWPLWMWTLICEIMKVVRPWSGQ